MSSSPIDVDSILDIIEAMRTQEERSYQVTDYLADLPTLPQHEAPVDEACRQVMAKWCNDIADFCQYSRETAAVAMNCLDRFMNTEEGRNVLLDRSQYQLAAMTALYTSVKVHEHEAMDPKLVSTLSRGAHCAEAVEEMENRMLKAIQWRVNPPTAMAFVRNMLNLVPDHLLGEGERETVVELTQFQIDLATCDYVFSQQLASSIAFASLLNAVESVTDDGMFYNNFETTMSREVGFSLSDLRNIRMALYEAVNGNEPMEVSMAPSNEKGMESYASSGEYNTSPRSVNA